MLDKLQGKVTVIYPEIAVAGGTKTYVDNLFMGLDKLGLIYQKVPIKKREYSIAGRPRFGFISQILNANFKHARTSIAHSLSPSSVIRGTNIVTVHDVLPLIQRDLYMRSRLQKISFNITLRRILNTQFLLVSSNIGKMQLLSHTNIDESRLFVLPLAINHEAFYPSSKNPGYPDHKIKVVMVSDFNPRKRIDIAIQALGNDNDIEFFHIGPINSWKNVYDEVKQMSKKFKNIHLMGQMDVDSVRSYISFADVFLYLTENEGFGLPPIEALACGTNVIVSDIQIFHENLGDIAFYARNDEFSADLVKEVIKKKKKREELVSFSEKYSIKNHAVRLTEIYTEVLEMTHGKG